jgi:simple sugar transport system permease protein
MIRVRLERRDETPAYLQILIPIGAVLVTLLLCAGLVWLAGANVLEAYRLLLFSTFQSGYDIQDTLVKAAPLLFTGLAVVVAFRAKFWNIGAEGQLMAGAIAAGFIGERLSFRPGASSGMIAGAACSVRSGRSSRAPQGAAQGGMTSSPPLLLNFIMLYGVTGLLEGPLARSAERQSELPVDTPGGGVSPSCPAWAYHLGIALALPCSHRGLVDAHAHHA